jgi:hypothetical protein
MNRRDFFRKAGIDERRLSATGSDIFVGLQAATAIVVAATEYTPPKCSEPSKLA